LQLNKQKRQCLSINKWSCIRSCIRN